MDFSGILLAGGKSRRFGPNKIKIVSGGIPLVAEQIVKLAYFTNEVIISASPENQDFLQSVLEDIENYIQVMEISDDLDLPDMRIVLDDEITKAGPHGIGPVAGIYTGLKQSKNNRVLVMASDMPLISYRLLMLLTRTAGCESGQDAVIIRNIEGIEALCGIYSKKCIKIIEEGILEGTYKISDILNGLKVRWIRNEELKKERIDRLNFFNINSGKDIKEYVNILEKGAGDHGTHNIHSRPGQKWKDYFFRGTGKGTGEERL